MRSYITLLITLCLNFVMGRDFYVGMFRKNDILVAQDRIYKERVPHRIQYATYGRHFKCAITYFRVVDRLGIGTGPKVMITRGGLRHKYVVLKIRSMYNKPISVNIYVGCENRMRPTPMPLITTPTAHPTTEHSATATSSGDADSSTSPDNAAEPTASGDKEEAATSPTDDGKTPEKSNENTEEVKLKAIRASGTVGAALTEQDTTFTCTDCKLADADVTCSNGLGVNAGVTPKVTEGDNKIELPGIDAFADSMACVCMGKFKFGAVRSKEVHKVVAIIDNAAVKVDKPAEETPNVVPYTCTGCKVVSVTENGVKITEITDAPPADPATEGPGSLTIAAIKQDGSAVVYQAVFELAAATRNDPVQVTKTVLELGLPPPA